MPKTPTDLGKLRAATARSQKEAALRARMRQDLEDAQKAQHKALEDWAATLPAGTTVIMCRRGRG